MKSWTPYYLQLADWRRRIATIYANVRDTAAFDPAEAVAHWRTEREHLYREHPQSPLPTAVRDSFQAHHFPYDAGMRFTLPVQPDEIGDRSPGMTAIPYSTGESEAFERFGWVEVPFPHGSRRMALFWMPGYSGGIFLSFRDHTNGNETYSGGRYLLDGAKSADLGGGPEAGTVILDFNFAYQPSCAFDPQWNCPLVPAENQIDLAVRAGERLR